VFKETTRKYKNALDEIESLHTAFNKLFDKHEKFLETHENLCEENKALKHNFENENTLFEKIKKELLLARESLCKRPVKENQTLDGIIKENIGLRKILSNSNINKIS